MTLRLRGEALVNQSVSVSRLQSLRPALCFFPTLAMKARTKSSKLRRIYSAVYRDARRAQWPPRRVSNIPGPLFDCVVIGLTIVLGILHLV